MPPYALVIADPELLLWVLPGPAVLVLLVLIFRIRRQPWPHRSRHRALDITYRSLRTRSVERAQIVLSILDLASEALLCGAVVTIETTRIRVRELPIEP